MTKSSRVLTSKKALLWVFAVAALLVGLILLRSFLSQSPNLSSTEGRQQYLSRLGWEIDPESESFRTVIVPDQLEGIMAQYNKLQLKQGYDLSRHLGESCLQYCYEITNYPDSDGKVLVSLYLQDGQIIAAVIAVDSDAMGRGDAELGHILMKGLIYALAHQESVPKTMLFYNGGASLTCEGSESLEDIKELEARGTEILTCGTCLDFYGLREKLAVGGVTNLYAIAQILSSNPGVSVL